MDDRILIKTLKKDPERGIRTLVNEYSALVMFVLRGRLSGVCDNTELEAVCADVFSEFYLSLEKFDTEKGTVKAYLCKIAKNAAADRYGEFAKSAATVSLDDEDLPEGVFESDFSVEEDLLTEEFKEELLSEIKALGEPDCEIIIRKFYLSEPSKSIAASLGMTVSAVDTRTHRALKKLKEKLSRFL